MMQEWITVTELSQKRPELKGIKHAKQMSDGSHIPESTMISVRDLQTRLLLFIKGNRPLAGFSIIDPKF